MPTQRKPLPPQVNRGPIRADFDGAEEAVSTFGSCDRSFSLPNTTVSKPAVCNARRSFGAPSTSAASLPAASYSGAPSKAPTCTIAMTGLRAPNTRTKLPVNGESSSRAARRYLPEPAVRPITM